MGQHTWVMVRLVLICMLMGCQPSGSTEQRIANLSLEFVAKGGLSEGPEGPANRVAALLALVRQGAFRQGMSARQVRDVLGEPDSVWHDPPDNRYDLRYLYVLGSVDDLEVFFKNDRLLEMDRIVDGPTELGGGLYALRLPEEH